MLEERNGGRGMNRCKEKRGAEYQPLTRGTGCKIYRNVPAKTGYDIQNDVSLRPVAALNTVRKHGRPAPLCLFASAVPVPDRAGKDAVRSALRTGDRGGKDTVRSTVRTGDRAGKRHCTERCTDRRPRRKRHCTERFTDRRPHRIVPRTAPRISCSSSGTITDFRTSDSPDRNTYGPRTWTCWRTKEPHSRLPT